MKKVSGVGDGRVSGTKAIAQTCIQTDKYHLARVTFFRYILAPLLQSAQCSFLDPSVCICSCFMRSTLVRQRPNWLLSMVKLNHWVHSRDL